MLHFRPRLSLIHSVVAFLIVLAGVTGVLAAGCWLRSRCLRERSQVTFNRDIAPIMFRSCSQCHRPGEAAPFSLLNYSDAKRHARQIADLTRSRVMPPWLPEPQELKFADELRIVGQRDRADQSMGGTGFGGRKRCGSASDAEVCRGMASREARSDSDCDQATRPSSARNRYVLELHLSGSHRPNPLGESR